MSGAQPVPAEALHAGRQAAAAWATVENPVARLEAIADAVLAAAAPYLHAQPVVLVWRDERGDEICHSAPLAIGQTRIAIPLDAFCADLTGGPS